MLQKNVVALGSLHEGLGHAVALRAFDGREARLEFSAIMMSMVFWAAKTKLLSVSHFAHDQLWWTFADPDVRWIGTPTHHRGERMRRTTGGWSNTDVLGRPLRVDGLSTKLTKVQIYQRTICRVEAEHYLLRRINGIEDPLVALSVQATNTMLDVLSDAIAALHWRGFETLADIVFARSGWHRASALGGTQKLTDIVLEQPATGDLAAIQVKSATGQ